MNAPDDLDLDALPAGDQLKLARLQKVQRETELLESKLAERRRELVRLDDVEKLWEYAILAIRNTILGFGAIREDDRHALLLEIADCHAVAVANAFGQDAPTTTDTNLDDNETAPPIPHGRPHGNPKTLARRDNAAKDGPKGIEFL